MAVSEWIEKLGRAIFETPFGAARVTSDAPELAEIRLAVLEAVKGKSHRVAGRDVFPFNLVRVNLRGSRQEQADILKGAFVSQFFEQELRTGLSRSNYRFPADLQVEVRTTEELPGPKQRWLWIEMESIEKPAEVVTPSKKPARLVVVKGTANEKEMVLSKTRTNIGRGLDVYRSDGPSRRNDRSVHEDSEINRSVSREHAHVVFHKRISEYRIYNDRWYKPGAKSEGGCGLLLIPDGLRPRWHRNARAPKQQAGERHS